MTERRNDRDRMTERQDDSKKNDRKGKKTEYQRDIKIERQNAEKDCMRERDRQKKREREKQKDRKT